MCLYMRNGLPVGAAVCIYIHPRVLNFGKTA